MPRRQRYAMFLLTFLSLAAPAAPAATPALPLIPWPDSVQTCPGTARIDADTTLVAPSDARAVEIAGLLREALATRTGLRLASPGAATGADPAAGASRIQLRRDPRIAGEEAYRLEIGRQGATIAASDDAGLLWGVQTLRQLLPAARPQGFELPCLRVADAPVLAYRGQMLDVARHFYPVEFIKRQLDVLSAYKINTFRWHLTDDQGWRIQIRRYPKLTEVGAWRTEADGTRHGGYYTQDQVREVVEYARRRGIMVIPEIEMPGHATAALVAYPQLGCIPPRPAVPNYWGVHREIFCAGKEDVFGFLENVLDEVIALFPAPYVHIGGDEVPKERWRDCAPCQALIRREGLKDEAELQSWFVQRIQRYLRGKDRTMIGWDEILEGGMDRDAVIEVWRGEAEGRKALANGNRIINAGQYYFSTPQDRLGLREVFNRDPLADPVYRAHATQVWGAEAPLWSEYITPRNGEAMLYPRMLGFAEIAWNAGKPHDFDDFKRRLAPHYGWLESQGIAYGPEEAPLVDYVLGYDRARRHWTLQAEYGFPDMRSRYTLDGSAPSGDAPGFDRQVAIERPGHLRVAPFRGSRQAAEAEDFALVSHQALGAAFWLTTPAKAPYPDAAMVLGDGVLGGAGFGDGSWTGWQGVALDATVDLGRARDIRRVAVRFLQESGSWVVLPRQVTVSVSDDGRNWRAVYQRELQPDALRSGTEVETVAYRATQPLRARWLRVQADPYGVLPAGHMGAGSQAWLFADEIVVE